MDLITIIAIVCYISALSIYVIMPYLEFAKKDKEFNKSFTIKDCGTKKDTFTTTKNKIKVKSNKEFYNKYYFRTFIYLLFVLIPMGSQILFVQGEIGLLAYVSIILFTSYILAFATINNEPNSVIWGSPNISNRVLTQLINNLFILFLLPLNMIKRVDVLINAHYYPKDSDILNKFSYIEKEDILKIKNLNTTTQIFYTFKHHLKESTKYNSDNVLLNFIRNNDPLKSNIIYEIQQDEELFINYFLYLQILNYKLNNPLNLVFVSTFTEEEIERVEKYLLEKLNN